MRGIHLQTSSGVLTVYPGCVGGAGFIPTWSNMEVFNGLELSNTICDQGMLGETNTVGPFSS